MDRSLWPTCSTVWLHTFITHVNSNTVVMWETQRGIADWDCFKTPILQEILRTQNQHQEEFLCIFGSHTFVPISWMCKKQASVSHSFTESEIISLSAGLRMGGIPALDLWNFVIEVFHCSPNLFNNTKDSLAQGNLLHRTTSSKRTKNRTKAPTTHDSSDLVHVDHVPSNAKFSQSNAMLYVSEG